MITGTHILLYSKDPEADRAFFRDTLNFRSVDAGGGWLIFALPPAELGVHPSMDNFVQTHAEHSLLGAVLYLMCDDLDEAIKKLKSRNVSCTKIETAEWGITTSVKLPSGGEIGLYQPTHPTAIDSGVT
jgi:hypothetical protein